MKRICGFMKKRSSQIIAVSIVAIYNLILYIGIPIYMTPVPVQFPTFVYDVCDTSMLSFAAAFNIFNLVNAHFVPFAIMLIATVIMIKLMYDSKKAVERSGHLGVSRSNRDVRFAVTNIAFNVIFVCMRVPIVVTSIYGYTNISTYYTILALLMFYAQPSTSLTVHAVSNSLFRRELKRFLRIDRSTRQVDSNTNDSASHTRTLKRLAAAQTNNNTK